MPRCLVSAGDKAVPLQVPVWVDQVGSAVLHMHDHRRIIVCELRFSFEPGRAIPIFVRKIIAIAVQYIRMNHPAAKSSLNEPGGPRTVLVHVPVWSHIQRLTLFLYR